MSVAVLSAVEQLAMLRSRVISAEELVQEHLARIERLNPQLGAFVEVDVDHALAAARAIDANRSDAGALAGLPVSIKSSIQVAGLRCEIGSRLNAGMVAPQDAAAVRRLRQAGAVVLGTTNCPEFLMAYETANLLYGETRNPWNLEQNAGGSSGGEAAAIAAGLSAGGLGSDSGGSVREPAHFTGICALKPTPGRISAEGHTPPCVGPFSSLGSLGPMARTIADVELLFEALCAEDEGQAPYRRMGLEEARGATVLWMEDDGLVPVTDATRSAVRQAAAALESTGFRVKRTEAPAYLEEARRLWRVFFLQCGAMFYAESIAGKRAELSGTFRDFLDEAQAMGTLTAEALLKAWAETDQLRARYLAETRETPLLLTPVCSVPAFRAGERAWIIEGERVGYWDAMRFTQWFNLLAAPATVVPVGKSSDGLPIGVQIAGRPHEEGLVLAAARVIDEAFGYRVPPLARN